MPGGTLLLGGALFLYAGERILETSTRIAHPTERKLIFLLGTSLIFVGALSIAFSCFIIIVLIIVLALIVCCAVKSTADKKKLYSVVVVVLISAGMVASLVNLPHTTITPTPVATPTPMATPTPIETITPEIKITYPLDGAQVGVLESVKGTQENIPKDKAIWIVVFPYKSYNYHPVKEVRVQEDILDFSVPVTIGRPESVGEKFDIIAVLADKQAQEVFTNYLETAANNNWPGISNLPEGAEEYARVSVTRK